MAEGLISAMATLGLAIAKCCIRFLVPDPAGATSSNRLRVGITAPVGKAGVPEARSDREDASAFNVLHERHLRKSLHHAVVMHDDGRVVFPDAGNGFDQARR